MADPSAAVAGSSGQTPWRILLWAILFGVSPQDPIAYAGAAIVLLAATMLAVLLPTRRAVTVDAAAVLKG